MHQELFTWGKHVITPWGIFGMCGAFLFGARWVVQLYYSRLEGRPVMPLAFWVMSMVGSLITLTFFIGEYMAGNEAGAVGIAGNFFPSFIAGYNLYIEYQHRRKAAAYAAAKEERPHLEAKAPAHVSLSAKEAAAVE